MIISDIAMFVLKRDVKLQLTNVTNEELLSSAYRTLWQTGGEDSSGMYCASRRHDQPVW